MSASSAFKGITVAKLKCFNGDTAGQEGFLLRLLSSGSTASIKDMICKIKEASRTKTKVTSIKPVSPSKTDVALILVKFQYCLLYETWPYTSSQLGSDAFDGHWFRDSIFLPTD